ncbi:MAG: TolB family protein [Chloroflexota bacterium]
MNSRQINILFLVALIFSACGIYTTPESTEEIGYHTEMPPTSESINNCTKLVEAPFSGDGSLLASKPYSSGNIVLIDMETFVSKEFPSFGNVRISPTGDALVYLNYKNNTWVLVLLEEARTSEIPLIGNVSFIEWANGRTVAIKNDYDPETYTLFLNLDTGETASINTDFPGFTPHARELLNIWDGIPAFDPSLEYAVYPTYDGMNLIRISDRLITAKIALSPAMTVPKWSPMGESFLVTSRDGNDLMRIYVDGHSEQVTNFGDQYLDSRIISYQWSPSAKKVAFWFVDSYSSSDNSRHLAISDLSSGRTVITCLRSKSQVVSMYDYPVWSPNDRYIVVNIYDEKDQTNQLYIIDTNNLHYSRIHSSSNLYPFGWLSFSLGNQ